MENEETTLIRIDRNTHKKLKDLAYALDVSMKDCIDDLITKAIQENLNLPLLGVAYPSLGVTDTPPTLGSPHAVGG